MRENHVPEIMTELRQDIVRVPKVIKKASGIVIFGKKIVQLSLRPISRLYEILMRMQ